MKRWSLRILGLAVLVLYIHHTDLGGDTYSLATGAHLFLDGIRNRSLPIGDAMGPFALLQYLPAIFMALLGAKTGLIVRLLVFVNVLVTAWTLREVFRYFKRKNCVPVFEAFIMVLLAGMPFWYVRSSYGEMLAADVTILFLLSVLEQRGFAWVFVTALLAAISKETALPFLIPLTVVAIRDSGRKPLISRNLLTLCLGWALGLALNMGFNEIRYGSLMNLNYGQALFRVPNLALKLHFFFGLLFSPSSGLVFVWPTLIAAWIWVGVTAVKRRDVFPIASITGTMAVLLVGLAHWYSPFGWTAWGPRLLLPWLVPCLFLMAVAYGNFIQTQLLGLGTKLQSSIAFRKKAAWTLGAFAFLSLASFQAAFGRQLLNYWFLAEQDSVCTELPVIQESAAHYFRCQPRYIWMHTPLWIRALRFDLDPLPCFVSVFCAAVWAVWVLRRSRSKDPI
jgi:hypothetical protein